MSNDFNNLIKEYEKQFNPLSNCKNLQELKEEYSAYLITKENVEDWIISNTEQYSDEYEEYYQIFDKSEYKFISEYGLPYFDESTKSDDINEIFTEHSSYFQRYGCMYFDQIISWDKNSMLVEDEIGNCEIITRPDVLMRQDD